MVSVLKKTVKLCNVREQSKIRKGYNQVSHLTQDTTWERDKNTRKRQTQESQEVSPFPAGDKKAAMNRQDGMVDTKYKDKDKEALFNVTNNDTDNIISRAILRHNN